ncbi:MAG: type II toxin-antitoxin system mRNA interferase toxin, RelE/StbE family [bacterium]|nr:type II toxin-antitoxin system mRNA interferase toxin, RelE/StbE family [bacterium]
MQIAYSAKFIKQYRKMSGEIKGVAEKKENIFRSNPFDPSLKTHKLNGRFEGFWAFSINYKYRIVFDFEENGKDVRFHIIGTHDIYE